MKKAVILVNIGSPDELNVLGVRRYLRNFLMDKRVIDVSFLFRYLLVNGMIVPFRAPKSLKSYQQILINGQSPLIYYSEQLQQKLQNAIGNEYLVRIAMMYGSPYLHKVLKELEKEHFAEIIFVPLYPQYASSTTGSAIEMFLHHIKEWHIIPSIKIRHTFYQHRAFVEIWARHIQKHLPEKVDFILFSYHGLPTRQIYKADKQFDDTYCNLNDCCERVTLQNQFCYRMNCIQTTKLILQQMKEIDVTRTGVCFQSRLGQSEWLKPYAIDYVEALAKKGIQNLVVVSPAFVTDCLETLYEIQIEYAEVFKKNGGDSLTLIPSLNAEAEWVNFLCEWIIE